MSRVMEIVITRRYCFRHAARTDYRSTALGHGNASIVATGSGLWSTVPMVHRTYGPPCLCSTTDRRVLCSIMSLVHRVYIQ